MDLCEGECIVSTWQLISLNSGALSENLTSSVGQTKVKSARSQFWPQPRRTLMKPSEEHSSRVDDLRGCVICLITCRRKMLCWMRKTIGLDITPLGTHYSIGRSTSFKAQSASIRKHMWSDADLMKAPYEVVLTTFSMYLCSAVVPSCALQILPKNANAK